MPASTPPLSRSTNDHFDGREFHNLDGAPAGRSLVDLLRWKWFGPRPVPWPAPPLPNLGKPELCRALLPGELAATFVGHSTFLLQFAGGFNVLTDPIWSERASPVSFAGPRRVHPPGIDFEALPPIHLVLVSHSHYDHLDLPTLRRLEAKFHPLFLTGLGNRVFLEREGLRRVEELDWWQSLSLPVPAEELAPLVVTFTPAQHWSKRSFFGRNQTLWGGFWLRQSGLNAYFAGDSGFGSLFAAIRERLGTPDVSFLPIGAYEPRWFMREQHMNPEEAVQVHRQLGSHRSVAMHFGTFQLTDEGIDAPVRALAESLSTRRLGAGDFVAPRVGETLRFGCH